MKKRKLFTLLLLFGWFISQGGTYRTVTSSSTLNWNSSSSWQGGAVPPSNQNATHNIYINSDITRTGGWTFRNDKLFFSNSATLTITGNVNINKLTTSYSGSDGGSSILRVNGNMKVFYSTTLTIAANVVIWVDGLFSNTGSSKINNEGFLNVGVLSVTNGAVHKGGGSLAWGSGSTGQGKIGASGSCYGNNSTLPNNGGAGAGLNLTTCNPVSPLPVKFISFEALCTPEGVSLDWSTATEKDNSHFEIEKAVQSLEFQAIGEVEGNGTTSTESNYTFIDRDLESSTAYYRLRQVDYNGVYDYSKVVVATCDIAKSEFSVYPSVSDGRYMLRFNQETLFLGLQVFNHLGEIKSSFTVSDHGKANHFNLDLEDLAAGLYYLKVKMNDRLETVKVVKR